MSSPYPIPGYRPGATAYSEGRGLSGRPASMLDLALQTTQRREAIQRLEEAIALSEARKGTEREDLRRLREQLAEWRRRGQPNVRTMPGVSQIPKPSDTARLLRRFGGRAVGLSSLHPFVRAAMTALDLWAAVSEEPDQADYWLSWPGFRLKVDCGWSDHPAYQPKFFYGRDHWPSASLGCLGGQAMQPHPVLSPYTDLEKSEGFALLQRNAAVNRYWSVQIWEPLPLAAGLPEGAGPAYVWDKDRRKPQTLPWKMIPKFPPTWWRERGPARLRTSRRHERPDPLRKKMPEVFPPGWPGPEPKPAPEPGALPPARPPRVGEREKKGTVSRVITQAVGNVTEAFDHLDAAWDALPCSVRRRYQFPGRRLPVSVEEKAEAVWQNFRSIDLTRYAFNLLWEQVEDQAYALAGRPGQTAAFSGSGRQLLPSSAVDVLEFSGKLPTSDVKEFLWRQASGRAWPTPATNCGQPPKGARVREVRR